MSENCPRPSQESIDAWIDGKISPRQAREIEAFFERHPEELPERESTLPSSILQAAVQASSSEDDPTLTSIITALKTEEDGLDEWGRSGGEVLDFLEESSEPGSLGRLENYEVISVLAISSMSIVLKAHDRHLDRKVAVKVLSPILAAHQIARERFLREARVMASLEHDHIVPVYEIQQDRLPWFAMRYIEGGTLQDALDDGMKRLRDPELLESIAKQIASALESAHASGTIHRDLKPANILISPDASQIWLTDFGIARFTEDPELTYGDAIPGTPRYMSPEQVRGQAVDWRSDYFSFGGVLYHLATGKPPFQGQSNTAILHQISSKEPEQIQLVNPQIPRWLSYFIECLMKKDPAQRPEGLSDFLSQHRMPKKETKVRAVIIGVICLLLTGLGFGIWFGLTQSGREDHSKNQEEFSRRKESQILNDNGQKFTSLHRALVESPPGSTLALRGHFILTEPVEAPVGDLHLKSDAGEQAVIEIDHQKRFGITVRGNVSVRNIHFIRRTPLRSSHTLAVRGARSLVVEGCRFTTPVTRAGTFVYGVSAFSCDHVQVKQCTFHGKRFYSVLVTEDQKKSLPGKLTLDLADSYFAGSTGVFVRLGLNRPRLELTCSRVIMNGKRFIRFGPQMTLGPTVLTMHSCLLGSRNEHILFENASQETLAEYLEWRGRDNVYSPAARLLRVTNPRLSLSQINDLQDAFPESVEVDSQHQLVFDLFGKIHPKLDGSARETFLKLCPN